MIYKIYEGLSDYLIAPDGTAIQKKTSEVIPFQRTPLVGEFTVKLITDEVYTFLNGKRKAIKLVRRFTREELVKMYNRSKQEFIDGLGEIPYTTSVPGQNDIQKTTFSVPKKGKCIPSTEPEHVANVNKAMADIGQIIVDAMSGSGLNIPEGYVLEEAGTITQEQMDQLSASKRVVKSNPKAPKTLVKKVKKAIGTMDKLKPELDKLVKEIVDKELQSESPDIRIVLNQVQALQPMKLPYLSIDGIHYQSARQASKATGVSVNTVLKRAKANKDGWFYIEA